MKISAINSKKPHGGGGGEGGEENMRQYFWKCLTVCLPEAAINRFNKGESRTGRIYQLVGKFPPWNETPMHTEGMSLHQKGIIRDCFLGVLSRGTVTNRLETLLFSFRKPVFKILILSALPWNLDQYANPAKEEILFGVLQSNRLYQWSVWIPSWGESVTVWKICYWKIYGRASVWGKHDTDLMQTAVKSSKPSKMYQF